MMEKYSLFRLEKEVCKHYKFESISLTEKCMKLADIFETLERAKISQETFSKNNIKTIILPSY